jgi:hypothetical protein
MICHHTPLSTVHNLQRLLNKQQSITASIMFHVPGFLTARFNIWLETSLLWGVLYRQRTWRSGGRLSASSDCDCTRLLWFWRSKVSSSIIASTFKNVFGIWGFQCPLFGKFKSAARILHCSKLSLETIWRRILKDSVSGMLYLWLLNFWSCPLFSILEEHIVSGHGYYNCLK